MLHRLPAGRDFRVGLPHVEWALDLFSADGRDLPGSSEFPLYWLSSARRIRLCWEATRAPRRIALRLDGSGSVPGPLPLRPPPPAGGGQCDKSRGLGQSPKSPPDFDELSRVAQPSSFCFLRFSCGPPRTARGSDNPGSSAAACGCRKPRCTRRSLPSPRHAWRTCGDAPVPS